MANNRIPRNAKKIYITWLIDTSATRTGDRDTVERIDNKWIGTSATGATYSMPVSILRNANVVQVDQIETDEPNNRKDVLLSDIGTQVYIIDGASRTDKAAQAVITALCNNGRITGELAERAKSDRPTLDKIKKNMIHAQMETRETETGKRWTFYTKNGVFMDIPAYSRNYITADADGNLYAVEAPTETENTEGKEDTTTAETEPQRATETAQKTADDTTTAGSDTDRTEAAQTEEKTIRTGERLYSHPHRHMVTVEGLQEGLVMVVYRGRLYLVSANDLYTDESETTPAILPPQAAESAEKTANDTTHTAADTEPCGAVQSHHEPPEVYHRATAEHAQQPHRATERTQADNVPPEPIQATTGHGESHNGQRCREKYHTGHRCRQYIHTGEPGTRNRCREEYHRSREEYHPTQPRLRECPRTNGTSTGRTSTHTAHKKPATGSTESRPQYQPRQPGPAKSNFFRLDAENRSDTHVNLWVPQFFEGFLKKLIRNFRGLKTKK